MRPDGERIAMLEQKVVDLSNKVDGVAFDVKEIRVMLSAQTSYEDRLKRLERQNYLWRWLSPILSAAISAVLAFLLISYLQRH